MVFKRREKLSWWRFVVEGVWPRAGWPRVINYFRHRIRRLPDPPHRVARGMFAGTFVAILPLPGLQFVLGGLLAWAIRGNLLAALLCTFLSNPLTTPFIAVASIGLGQWMLGQNMGLTPRMIGHAFADAGADLWHNVTSAFTPAVAHWDGLQRFWTTIYLPYFVGATVIGVVVALVAYYITIPLVAAYQRARARRLRDRIEKKHRARRPLAERAAALQQTSKGDEG